MWPSKQWSPPTFLSVGMRQILQESKGDKGLLTFVPGNPGKPGSP